MKKIPITHAGFEKLKQEINDLKYKERPRIIQAISEAREHGDLSENAEYHAAKEKQRFIEDRIYDLDNKFSNAEIIDTRTLSGDTVKFGATVTLINDDTGEETTYSIVSEYEADIRNGLLSIKSPVARALIGKSTDDEVRVKTPNGMKVYEIKNILYKELKI